MTVWGTETLAPRIYTVSEVNEEIRHRLEAWGEVWIRGEVSNLRTPASGHIYFTLKDNQSQIRAVVFRPYRVNIRFILKEGMEILILGRLSVYSPRGEYQIIGEYLEPVGVGALALAFENLKHKLMAEGLFETDRKRSLPLVPRRIGIITSPTGAAIRDMIRILRDRGADIHILIYPVRVQGEGAAGEIASAIEELNRSFPDLDAVILARGGGSLEDLWAFNEEVVARSIADSEIPVISAVGHEIDYTISDFVADFRVPTPTAAADLVADSRERFSEMIVQLRVSMVERITQLIEMKKKEVEGISGLVMIPSPWIEEQGQRLDELSERIRKGMMLSMQDRRMRYQDLSRLLGSLSPLAVLERGYSITTRAETGEVLLRAHDVRRDEQLNVRLSDGSLLCEVKKTIN